MRLQAMNEKCVCVIPGRAVQCLFSALCPCTTSSSLRHCATLSTMVTTQGGAVARRWPLPLAMPIIANILGEYLGGQGLLKVRTLEVDGRRAALVVACWAPAIVATKGLLQKAGALRARVWDCLWREDLAHLAGVSVQTGGYALISDAAAPCGGGRVAAPAPLACVHIWRDRVLLG